MLENLKIIEIIIFSLSVDIAKVSNKIFFGIVSVIPYYLIYIL